MIKIASLTGGIPLRHDSGPDYVGIHLLIVKRERKRTNPLPNCMEV
jgi:hypothetical protein